MNISVNFEIGNTQFENFAEFEAAIHSACMEIGRNVIKKALEKKDYELAASTDTKEMRNKGYRATSIKTVCGCVEYRRHVFEKETDGKKKCIYPLDDYMGKAQIGKMSMLGSQLMVESALNSSYRDAAQEFSKKTGLSVSHQAVWNVTQQIGQLRQEQVTGLTALAKANQGKGKIKTKVLYQEADGIWLHLQGEDRNEKTADGAEMKVSIAYDGIRYTSVDSEGKAKRRELDNKVAYAGFYPARDFKASMDSIIAEKYSVSNIKAKVLNGDGGFWIRSMGGEGTIHVLDEFHRNKAVTKYVTDPEVAKRIHQFLNEEKIKDLLEYLEAMVNSVEDQEEKEKLSKLFSYYKTNEDALKSCYTREEKIPATRDAEIHHARLGSMESNVFTLIGNRMKGRRRCWSIRGATNLAVLLCLQKTEGIGSLCKAYAAGKLCDEVKIAEEPKESEEAMILTAGKVAETSGHGYEGMYQIDIPDMTIRRALSRNDNMITSV